MRQFFEGLTTIDQIQALIDTKERESDNLEYKKATQLFGNSEKDDIAKDVSSFANSGGGVIIYGVATDPIDKTKPIAIDAIHTTNIETFDRVVNSKIQPPVTGWEKRLIPKDQPQVMVIFVPQSNDPPHQSLSDKKYYRRAGIESIPMTHDLIVLLSERAKRKRLRYNLQLQYDSFKEECIHLFFSAMGDAYTLDQVTSLKNRDQFREFFKGPSSTEGQTRWDAVANGLDAQHIKLLGIEFEILRDEINFTLNAIDVNHPEAFAFLKRLSQILHRTKQVSPGYDDEKALLKFLWSVHTGWSFAAGYQEKDVIAEMIEEI